MTAGRVAGWTLVAALAGALGMAAIYVPRWLAQRTEPAAPVEAAPPAPSRHIKATLFYVSDDGLRLVPTEREVPFADGLVAQARRIVEAQLERPPEPLVSAIPAATTLRAIYLSERGDAFVDLSAEVSSAHPGGALDELLTVYSIVNVLTTNLPAVSAVQILVDGRQVDTLAGHVDLRRPLARGAKWLQPAGTAAGPPMPPATGPAQPLPIVPAAGTPVPAGGDATKR